MNLGLNVAIKISAGHRGLPVAPSTWASTPFRYPPITLERSGRHFWADDDEIMDKYCNTEGSTQLVASSNWQWGDYDLELSYETLESDLGRFGQHGPIIVALDEMSCTLLSGAFWDNAWSENPEPSPLADLIGVAPPPPETDWYFACQFE